MAFSSIQFTLVLISTVAVLVSAETSYNSKTQLCCNGNVRDKNGSDRLSCCGSTPYDYETSLCCMHDQVLDFPTANTHSYGCCTNQETNISEIYNYKLQECCDGKALDKPNATLYYSCCNGELYHYSTHVCCDNEIKEIGEDDGCCGEKELYKSNSQMCCEKYELDNGNYRVAEYKITDRTNNETACCGLETFDMTKEVCCEDTIKPKIGDIGNSTWGMCCESEPYDYKTQACCKKWGQIDSDRFGVVSFDLHDIEEGETAYCCGLELYNHNKEICCYDETVIPKPEGCDEDTWFTCCGGEAIVNHTTQICHENKIYPRENYNFDICDGEMYNTEEEFCCGDERYNSSSTMACCYGADMAYNQTKEKCCFDEIKPLTGEDLAAGHDSCCTAIY